MHRVYQRNMPHIDNGRQAYFLTFCTRDRWILPHPARSIVLDCCIHTKVLKGYSAFRINRELGRTGSVWQDETYDHVIRGGEMQEMFIYALFNPVRKGLVSTPEEYEWLWWNQERREVEPLQVRTF